MSSKNREARVYYGPGAFRMLANGDHVLCAVTGAVIPLDELRYWSVEKQEAYASVDLSAKAHLNR